MKPTTAQISQLKDKLSSDKAFADTLEAACKAGDTSRAKQILDGAGIKGDFDVHTASANCPPNCVQIFFLCLC